MAYNPWGAMPLSDSFKTQVPSSAPGSVPLSPAYMDALPPAVIEQLGFIQAPPQPAFQQPMALPLIPEPSGKGSFSGGLGNTRTAVPQGKAPPVSSEIQAAMRALDQSGQGLKGAQELNLADLHGRLRSTLEKDMPVDLSALATLTDQWSGSNMASSYKVPETPQERAAAIAKLQDQIGQGQLGIASTDLDMNKQKLQQALGIDERGYKRGQDQVQNNFEQQKIDLMRDKAAKEAKAGGLSPKDAFDMKVKLSGMEPAKQARGITGFLEAMNEYERAVNKHGISPTGEGASVLNSAYAKMSTRFKEAENLGALSGPDLDLLKQNVKNAGGWDAWFSGIRGGKDGIKAAIGQARRGAANDFELAYKNLEDVSSGVPEISDVLTGYRSQYDKVTSEPGQMNMSLEQKRKAAEAAWLKANGGK